MAFRLYVYTFDSDYDPVDAFNNATRLDNGAPYSLESFEDGGPAPVVRLGQTSPDQQGMTDLGYRIQPRTFVAKVLFQDGEDIDGGVFGDNRDWLFSTFRPSRLLKLRMIRDDGEERILECHTLSIEIDLVPENYPAGLNRATITLRAAQPLWYTATAKSSSYAGTSQWWTGDGAIGTTNVMEHGNYPAQGQAWEYQGTITGAWSIMFRGGSAAVAAGTAITAIYHAGTSSLGTAFGSSQDARIYSTDGRWRMGTEWAFNSQFAMSPGTANYIQTHDGTTWRGYQNGTVLERQTNQDIDITGTTRRWRSDRAGSAATYFLGELSYYAVYNVQLSAGQRSALSDAVTAHAASGTATGTVTAVNDGDVHAFPTITLRGPIANPVLTNLATDDVIDLTGISVPANSTYTLDLSDGHKSFTNISGSSLLGSMGTPVQLAGWSLAPDPIATGGTNLIRVQGGSMTTDTLITVSFYDRHMSF